MKKSALPRNPSYYDRYIDQVEDLDLSEAISRSTAALEALDLEKLRALGDRVYEPGKWTVREIFQHMADAERVFAYRALRFARNDKTELPGFDEGVFAEHTRANQRPLEDILAEMRSVRDSTKRMFDSFDEAALRRTGVMSNTEASVLHIGFTLLGHQLHHFRVLEERYFPLMRNEA